MLFFTLLALQDQRVWSWSQQIEALLPHMLFMSQVCMQPCTPASLALTHPPCMHQSFSELAFLVFTFACRCPCGAVTPMQAYLQRAGFLEDSMHGHASP